MGETERFRPSLSVCFLYILNLERKRGKVNCCFCGMFCP